MSLSCMWVLLLLAIGFAGAQLQDESSSIDLSFGSSEEADLRRSHNHMSGQPLMNLMRKKRPTPLAPTQWQMMISPFLRMLPDASNYCHCKGMADCGCCLGMSLKPFLLRNNICTNMSLTRDSYTGSNNMFRTKIHYDTFKIIDISVSEREAPKVCLTPPMLAVGGCAQITNMHMDRMQGKFCSCFGLSIEYHERSVFQLPVGCVCVGRPVAEEDKRGLFGINFVSLASHLSNLLPLIG